jgi:hypothetical protein
MTLRHLLITFLSLGYCSGVFAQQESEIAKSPPAHPAANHLNAGKILFTSQAISSAALNTNMS